MVSADLNSQKLALPDLSRVVAVVQSSYGALLGPAGGSPTGALLIAGQERVATELAIAECEDLLSGSLA